MTAARRAARAPHAKGYRFAHTLLPKLLIYAVLTIGAIAMVLPFFWMVTTSLKQPDEIYILPIQWLPKSPDLGRMRSSSWNTSSAGICSTRFGSPRSISGATC